MSELENIFFSILQQVHIRDLILKKNCHFSRSRDLNAPCGIEKENKEDFLIRTSFKVENLFALGSRHEFSSIFIIIVIIILVVFVDNLLDLFYLFHFF